MKGKTCLHKGKVIALVFLHRTLSIQYCKVSLPKTLNDNLKGDKLGLCTACSELSPWMVPQHCIALCLSQSHPV